MSAQAAGSCQRFSGAQLLIVAVELHSSLRSVRCAVHVSMHPASMLFALRALFALSALFVLRALCALCALSVLFALRALFALGGGLQGPILRASGPAPNRGAKFRAARSWSSSRLVGVVFKVVVTAQGREVIVVEVVFTT